MRRSLAKFNESEASNHTPSWADFITATPAAFKLSVHTRIRRDLLEGGFCQGIVRGRSSGKSDASSALSDLSRTISRSLCTTIPATSCARSPRSPVLHPQRAAARRSIIFTHGVLCSLLFQRTEILSGLDFLATNFSRASAHLRLIRSVVVYLIGWFQKAVSERVTV